MCVKWDFIHPCDVSTLGPSFTRLSHFSIGMSADNSMYLKQLVLKITIFLMKIFVQGMDLIHLLRIKVKCFQFAKNNLCASNFVAKRWCTSFIFAYKVKVWNIKRNTLTVRTLQFVHTYTSLYLLSIGDCTALGSQIWFKLVAYVPLRIKRNSPKFEVLIFKHFRRGSYLNFKWYKLKYVCIHQNNK